MGRGDGEVEDEGVASGDLGEQVDVALDELGFGDDAEAIAGSPGEDFEDGPGDAGGTLDGLVRIRGGAEGDFAGGVDLLKFLFEQPGGILLKEDEALKEVRVVEVGSTDLRLGWGEELVGVARVAVAARELAASVGVDGPLE